MTDRILLKKSIGRVLGDSGFKRKGQSWYLHGSDCIVVLNLQKDDFSDLYYVNFGVWLRALGSEQYPPAHKCHLVCRLEELFVDRREMIFDACTINPDNSDLLGLLTFLENEFVPFAKTCLTTMELKNNIKSGRIPIYHVYLAAKLALGLVTPAE